MTKPHRPIGTPPGSSPGGNRDHGITRRSFMGKSAAGLTSVAFSSALLEALLSSTGCKPGPGGAGGAASGVIIPDDILAKAVSQLMAKGADFGDVYVERAAFDSVMNDDRKINTMTTIEKGVGFRAVKDGRTFYAYTDSFEPDRLYETARYVADAAATPAASGAPAVMTLTPLDLRARLPHQAAPLGDRRRQEDRALQGPGGPGLVGRPPRRPGAPVLEGDHPPDQYRHVGRQDRQADARPDGVHGPDLRQGRRRRAPGGLRRTGRLRRARFLHRASTRSRRSSTRPRPRPSSSSRPSILRAASSRSFSVRA